MKWCYATVASMVWKSLRGYDASTSFVVFCMDDALASYVSFGASVTMRRWLAPFVASSALLWM